MITFFSKVEIFSTRVSSVCSNFSTFWSTLLPRWIEKLQLFWWPYIWNMPDIRGALEPIFLSSGRNRIRPELEKVSARTDLLN
jgi:hypothetical protein